jgi:hypothetical protein
MEHFDSLASCPARRQQLRPKGPKSPVVTWLTHELDITPRIINSLSLQLCDITESIAVLWALSKKVPPTKNQLPVQIYPNNQNPEEQLTRYSLQICDIRETLVPLYGE